MQVLDDEHHRTRVAEPTEQPQDALEDADLDPFRLGRCRRCVGSGAGQLRHEPRKLGEARSRGLRDPFRVHGTDEAAQGFDDRAERQAVVTEGDRATFQDEPASVAEPAGDLGDEPALADPRLATDEDERRLAGRGSVGRRQECGQLPRTTDEDRAGQASSHGVDDRALPASPRIGCGPCWWQIRRRSDP